MKKEAINTWENGLLMDLNPINTPNNVLTDNLNGTLITYNGNEYSLQNDQGNYKLKYCRLKPNYIPVGVKEYGDVLYIVSYNPLNENVEIGSYPSPLLISEANLNNNNLNFNSILKQLSESASKEDDYDVLIQNTKPMIFNGHDFKLNPGDEYCIQLNNNSNYKYETLEYYITDEDNNSYNVSDKILVSQPKEIINYDDYHHIKWEVPGWLSVKLRLAQLSSSSLNIRSFYVPKNEEGKITDAYFSLNLKMNINDPLIIKNAFNSNDYKVDLGFRIKIIRKSPGKLPESLFNKEYFDIILSDNKSNINTEGDNIILSLNEFNYDDWYGNNKIVWKNIGGQIKNVKETDIYEISMIPFINEWSAPNNLKYKIIYNTFAQKLVFDLKTIDLGKWNSGNSIYKFYSGVDDEKIQINLTGPQITSSKINLYYRILNLNGDDIIPFKLLNNFNIGETYMSIPFDENFKRDDIYIINFSFAENLESAKSSKDSIYRLLITSNIFNEFMNDNEINIFDKDINFKDWIKKYKPKCNKFILSNKKLNKKEKVKGSKLALSGNKIFNQYWSDIDYSTFVPFNIDIPKKDEIIAGYYYDINSNINIEPIIQSGMWKDFKLSLNCQIKDNFEHIYNFNDLNIGSNSILIKNVPSYLSWNINYNLNDEKFKFGRYLSKISLKDKYISNLNNYEIRWNSVPNATTASGQRFYFSHSFGPNGWINYNEKYGMAHNFNSFEGDKYGKMLRESIFDWLEKHKDTPFISTKLSVEKLATSGGRRGPKVFWDDNGLSTLIQDTDFEQSSNPSILKNYLIFRNISDISKDSPQMIVPFYSDEEIKNFIETTYIIDADDDEYVKEYCNCGVNLDSETGKDNSKINLIIKSNIKFKNKWLYNINKISYDLFTDWNKINDNLKLKNINLSNENLFNSFDESFGFDIDEYIDYIENDLSKDEIYSEFSGLESEIRNKYNEFIENKNKWSADWLNDKINSRYKVKGIYSTELENSQYLEEMSEIYQKYNYIGLKHDPNNNKKIVFGAGKPHNDDNSRCYDGFWIREL